MIMSKEPFFEPWRSSTFHVVRAPPQDPPAPKRPPTRDLPSTMLPKAPPTPAVVAPPARGQPGEATNKPAGVSLPSICRDEDRYPGTAASRQHRHGSQTRMEQRRPYYSSIATQEPVRPTITTTTRSLQVVKPKSPSDKPLVNKIPSKTWTADDYGLPDIPHNEKITMTDYYGGSLSARAPSASRQPALNNFYQRLLSGRDDGYHQGAPMTARPEYDAPALERRAPRDSNVTDAGPPVFRSGNMGGSWRHVRQCLGNLGNHICFVDGGVKESDLKNYPPYGYTRPTETHTYISPRLSQRHPDNGNHGNQDNRPGNKYATKYNTRARKGFEYWNTEKPKQSVSPKQTIQGRMMKLGVGY